MNASAINSRTEKLFLVEKNLAASQSETVAIEHMLYNCCRQGNCLALEEGIIFLFHFRLNIPV